MTREDAVLKVTTEFIHNGVSPVRANELAKIAVDNLPLELEPSSRVAQLSAICYGRGSA